jgi:hypothetical protein
VFPLSGGVPLPEAPQPAVNAAARISVTTNIKRETGGRDELEKSDTDFISHLAE